MNACFDYLSDMNTCRKSLWLHRRGYTAQGGSHYVGPRTIQQCLDHCNDTASCVAVDIDVDVVPLRCWMHNNKDDLRSDNIFTQPGTDHYQLITRCPNARTGCISHAVFSVYFFSALFTVTLLTVLIIF